MQRYKNLLVPTSLLGYSLTAKITKQLRIYLFLKKDFNGVLKPDYDLLANHLGMSKKALKRHIIWLLANKWIGTDGTLLFVRKWSRIISYCKFQERTGTYLDDLTVLEDEQKFKAFAVSAVYAKLIRGQKAVEFNRVRKARRTLPRENLAASDSYFGVSSSLLSTVLEISKTKAVELKQLAIKHKYIKSIHHYKKYPAKNQTRDFARLVRKQGNSAVLFSKGSLVEQLYDEIYVSFKLKRIRKERITDKQPLLVYPLS